MGFQKYLTDLLVARVCCDQLMGQPGIEMIIILCSLWPDVAHEIVREGSAAFPWTIIFARQGFFGDAIPDGRWRAWTEPAILGVAIDETNIKFFAITV